MNSQYKLGADLSGKGVDEKENNFNQLFSAGLRHY